MNHATFSSRGGSQAPDTQTQQYMNDLKKNLRVSHFNMGNSAPETASTNHANYLQHTISPKSSNDKERLAKKMRSANFCFGND